MDEEIMCGGFCDSYGELLDERNFPEWAWIRDVNDFFVDDDGELLDLNWVRSDQEGDLYKNGKNRFF